MQTKVKKNSSIRSINRLEGITFNISNSFDERKKAYALAYQEYLKKGYTTENQYQKLIHPYDYSSQCYIINAYVNLELAGTITIVTGKKMPFLKVFTFDKNCNHHYTAELSRLAIASYHQRNPHVLLGLIDWAFTYSYHWMKKVKWLIQINPHHVGFYQKFMNFETVDKKESCPFANGAPAVLMQLNLNPVFHQKNQYRFISRESNLHNQLTLLKENKRNFFYHRLQVKFLYNSINHHKKNNTLINSFHTNTPAKKNYLNSIILGRFK